MNNERNENIRRAYFTSISPDYCKVKNCVKEIDDIKNILSAYQADQNISDLQYNNLDTIIADAELIALTCRKALACNSEHRYLEVRKSGNDSEGRITDEKTYRSENNLGNLFEDGEVALKDLPVTVSFDGELLSLYTPLTFKRGYTKNNFNSNYQLANYVDAAIRNWENNQQKMMINLIEKPFICVMKRTDYKFSIYKNCDADNLENQKIINTITRAFNLPDNAKNMSLFSIWDYAESGEKEGTYFYIFSEKNLIKHLDLFRHRQKDTVSDRK